MKKIMKGELSQLEISGAVPERNKAEVSVKEGVEKEIHQSSDGATKDPHYRYKMVKQICLVSGWICLVSIITSESFEECWSVGLYILFVC